MRPVKLVIHFRNGDEKNSKVIVIAIVILLVINAVVK